MKNENFFIVAKDGAPDNEPLRLSARVLRIYFWALQALGTHTRPLGTLSSTQKQSLFRSNLATLEPSGLRPLNPLDVRKHPLFWLLLTLSHLGLLPASISQLG